MLARWRLLAIGVICVLLLAAGTGAWSAQPLPSPEDSLRALLAAEPAPADLLRLHRELLGEPVASSTGRETAPRSEIGRVDRFWVGHAQAQERREVDAELRLVSRHAYWYVQRDRAIPDEALREAASVFEARIYPGVRRLIGSEPFPGIDNDPRVTILHADVPGIAGYVTSTDEYPRAVSAYSNEREMVYLNLGAVQPGSATYLGTLAHEFTHLVHGGAKGTPDTWVKEGLADLTADLILEGRAQPATPLGETDVPLTSWADATDDDHAVAAHYRLSELFLRYGLDRLGPGFLEWLDGANGGTSNWDQMLAGAGLPGGFTELYGQWAVANVIGDRTGVGVWPYKGSRVDLLAPRRVAAGDVITESVAQFGTDYFELGDAGHASLRFSGVSTVPALSGVSESASVWAAARADGAAAQLTCTATPGPDGPTMASYRVWYDIERGYDFAYVSVSPDGGKRWTLLRTPDMTTDQRIGNALGAGYTGKSGGERDARWLDQSVELPPSTGRSLQLRFTYVTDDAVTREGIAIGAVRFAGVGGGEERQCAEWTSQGWARIGPTLPQRWLVQLVEIAGANVRVEQVPIDASGTGEWSSEAQRADRLLLAISAVTPGTLQRAPYQIAWN